MSSYELKRTDTRAVPNLLDYPESFITNKYDKPQKNARKIKWEDDEDNSIYGRWDEDGRIKREEDMKKMPPPPVPSMPLPNSPPKSNKRKNLGNSPHPFKKRKEDSNIIIDRKDNIGKCPDKIILLLFDTDKNTPFRIVLNIKDYGYHMYLIFNWFKSNLFTINTNNIVLYAYSFIEDNYNNKNIIVDESISKIAIDICKEKSYFPFNKDIYKKDDSLIKYYDIINNVKRGILKTNIGSKLIVTNKLFYDIISLIVGKIPKNIHFDKIGIILDFIPVSSSDTIKHS